MRLLSNAGSDTHTHKHTHTHTHTHKHHIPLGQKSPMIVYCIFWQKGGNQSRTTENMQLTSGIQVSSGTKQQGYLSHRPFKPFRILYTHPMQTHRLSLYVCENAHCLVNTESLVVSFGTIAEKCLASSVSGGELNKNHGSLLNIENVKKYP